MNDLTVTLTGWTATTPRQDEMPNGDPVTSFRFCSTPRWFDKAQQVWRDGKSEWFTVRVIGNAALNVATSVHKGEPLIVSGRLSTKDWTTTEGADRTDLIIDASAVGHDLVRGTTVFTRPVAAEATH